MDCVSSPLAHVPIASRRKMASTVVLFAVLLLVIGVVALTGNGSGGATVLGVLALVIGATLALIAWGTVRSVRLDRAERELDATLEAAVAAHGMSCGCGQEHDPAELHITDECEHDGAGATCSHDCDSCALAALRPPL